MVAASVRVRSPGFDEPVDYFDGMTRGMAADQAVKRTGARLPKKRRFIVSGDVVEPGTFAQPDEEITIATNGANG